MLNKLSLRKMLKSAISIPLASLLTIGFSYPSIAEEEFTKLEDFCFRSPHHSDCEDIESYISLKKWKKNKTLCFLAAEWENEPKKCRVTVKDNQLIIYLEDGELSEQYSDTLKTKTMVISLDEIFTFNAQWWLADVVVTNVSSRSGDLPKYSETRNLSSLGTFPHLQIGFVTNTKRGEKPNGKFLTVSAKNIHQILEPIESWRYYLPDMTAFERQLKAQSSEKSNPNPSDIASNIAKLEETNQCPDCDLRNAELTGLNLENANLARSNLAGANLAESNLKNAYLLGANLDGANLNKADLETANLVLASLVEANLVEAKLKGSSLQNANLSNADLTGAELKPKDFQTVSLKNANLDNAVLTDADLRCVNLHSASLKNANLIGADLSSCEKKQSPAISSQLSDFQLNGRRLPYNVGNDIRNVLGLVGTLFGGGINYNSANIKFRSSSYLSGANLSGADLSEANLKGAYLIDTNLNNVNLTGTEMDKSILAYTNLIDTDITNSNLEKSGAFCTAIFDNESFYEEHCQEEEEEVEE